MTLSRIYHLNTSFYGLHTLFMSNTYQWVNEMYTKFVTIFYAADSLFTWLFFVYICSFSLITWLSMRIYIWITNCLWKSLFCFSAVPHFYQAFNNYHIYDFWLKLPFFCLCRKLFVVSHVTFFFCSILFSKCRMTKKNPKMVCVKSERARV